MPKRRWYRLEASVLQNLLARVSLRDGLLIWQALGEDPKNFPAGRPESRKKALQRLRKPVIEGDKMSAPIERNTRTNCPPSLRKGRRKPQQDQRIDPDKLSAPIERKKRTKCPAYPDPAGALAQELGGWRAGLLFRARKEQNTRIQELVHRHKETLLELLNLAESLPLPRRVPTTLAWLEEFASEVERLGTEEVQKVFFEVRKRGVENPLAYAAKVLKTRGKEEKVWTPTGEEF